MQPRRPYPGIGHAILMTLGFFAFSVVFGIPVFVVYAVASGRGMDGAESFMQSADFLIIINTLACGGVLLWGYAANRVPWPVLLPFRRIPWGALAAVVVTSVGLSSVLSEVDNIFRTFVPMSDSFLEEFAGILDMARHPWSTGIALVIVAPLTEETIFRGVMLRGLLARHGRGIAILVSSLLFGAAHLNPWQFVSAGLLGLFLGWWYFRTRSLLPSMLGHAFNNGLVALVGFLPFNIPGYTSPEMTTTVEHQPWWFTLAGVVLTGTGLWWFARCTRGGPPAEPGLETPSGPLPPPLPVHPLQYALAPLPVETAIAPTTDEASEHISP